MTPAQFRDEQHRAELARLAARPALTRAQLDLMDPQTAEGKARIKRETDSRDPYLQAKLTGKPVIDAMDVEAGRVDPARERALGGPEPQKREAIAAEQRGGLLAGLRRMVSGK